MPANAQSPPSPELSWTWFTASDPGLLRLRFAARATLSAALTMATLYGIGQLAGIPFMAMAFGIMISLFANVAVRDAGPHRQLTTTLLIPFPAAASFTLAAVLASRPILADLAFLAIIFAAVLGRGRGPRWAALGMIAYMAFFIGEFLHPKLGQLPDQLLGLAVGTAVAILSRFVLLPDDPETALPRVLRAIERQIALVLRDVGEALEAAHWSDTRRRRLREALAGLSESVLTAEDQMDMLVRGQGHDADQLRLRLFSLERATERLVTAAQENREPRAGAPALESLRALERHLRGEPFPAAEPVADGARDGGALARPLQELRWALEALPRGPGRTAGSAMLADARRGPRPVTRREKDDERQSDGPRRPGALGLSATTVQAIQVTTACGIAIGAGHLVSSQRWFWAVITAFVIFIGANSRGDAFYRGVQRVAGTLIGFVAGVLIATLLSGDPRVELGLMLVCLFFAFYSFQVSYAVMIFWFTIMLALLYGAMGYFSPSLLVVRIEETAVGAAAGVGVAAFLLPTRTRDAVRDTMREFLDALDQLVDTSAQLSKEPGRQGPPIDLVSKLERKFHAVRAATSALTFGWGLLAPGLIGRNLALLMACRYWAGEVAAAAGSCDAAGGDDFRRCAALVRERIRRLGELLDAPGARTGPGSGMDPAPDDGQGCRPVEGSGEPEAQSASALQALERIDDAIGCLARAISAQRKPRRT